MIDAALLHCAADIAPQTTAAIIQVESRGDMLAINVNGGRLPRAPSDAADAAKLARQMIAKGYSVDLGLMQVNSRNLGWLGYTVEEMFEPCKNIRAGAEVLRRGLLPSHSHARRRAARIAGSAVPLQHRRHAARLPQRLCRPLLHYSSRDADGARRAGTAEPLHGGHHHRFLQEITMSNSDSNTLAAPQRAGKGVGMVLPALLTGDPADAYAAAPAIASANLEDLLSPGVVVEASPDDAEALGAFEETALSEADAWASNADLVLAGEGGRDE